MRESPFLYPLMNLLHIFGLILLVGAIGLLDLRILGFGRQLPVHLCSRYLTPVAIVGLCLMLGSGFLIFSADAGPLSGSAIFQIKLLIVAAAIANAILFRAVWGKRIADWDNAPPVGGRSMAGASLLLWLAVAAHGRMIAYS